MPTVDQTRRKKVAIASLGCSVVPMGLSVWALGCFVFAPDTKKNSEDLLTYGIIAVCVSPLAIVGLGLGVFARGFRSLCRGFGSVSLVCWGVIVLVDGLKYALS